MTSDQPNQSVNFLAHGAVVSARVPWMAVISFALLSCGLAWLVTLPLWVGEGISSPFAPIILPLMMFTPAASALVIKLVIGRPARQTTWRMFALSPTGPTVRFLAGLAVGFAIAVSVPVLATIVAASTGALELDLVNYSGFVATLDSALETAGVPASSIPIAALVVAQIALIPIGAITNSFLAFGEEVAWRGWLLSALAPLGTWPALLISGAIWGVWHAPLVLLGYNFAEPNVLGLGVMVVGCVTFGVLLGWMRLKFGNIWPAVLGHGAFNAAAGFALLLSAEDPHPLAASPLSWPGWLACAGVAVLLLLLGQFRSSRLQAQLT